MNRKLMGNIQVLHLFEQLWHEKFKQCWEYVSNINTTESPTNKERFVEDLIHTICSTIPLQEHLHLTPDVKSTERAVVLRAKGFEMYHPRVGNYHEAIKFYNESIAHTELNSPDRGIAYANRSIVCMALKRYQDCLENVRLARGSNYPARFLPKLAERAALAEDALRRAKTKRGTHVAACGNSTSECKESNEPNRKDCLAVAHNANERWKNHHQHAYGLAVVEYLNLYTHCNFCHSEQMFTLIPCEGCTVAMYCSVQCLYEAYQKYHRYECGLARDLWQVCGIRAVTAFRKAAAEIASFKDMSSSLEYPELFVTLPERCGLALPAMSGKLRTRERSFRIFLATIVHGLMMDRTMLGWLSREDYGMQQLVFQMILYYLNCFLDG